MKREIMITTAHRVYICASYDEFAKKAKALTTLNIHFNIYWKVGNEFVNMSNRPVGIF